MYSVGIRPPYSRWWNAVVEFLRQVVEPYLRIFRRVLPMFGPFDLSPMVATFVLIIVWRIVGLADRGLMEAVEGSALAIPRGARWALAGLVVADRAARRPGARRRSCAARSCPASSATCCRS